MRRPTIRHAIGFLTCLICLAAASSPLCAQSPPFSRRGGILPGGVKGGDGRDHPDDQAGQEINWQRYSSRGEEFSALLPARPVMASVTRPRKLFEERKDGRMYAAYADGMVYVILSLDNPHRKEALELFIEEFQRYPVFHSALAFEREVMLNGFKGKQYQVKASAASGVSGIAQFYLAKNHTYIFEVVGDQIESPSVNQFLTSLTLDGKSEGQDIVELSREVAPPSATTTDAPTRGGTNQSAGQQQVLNPKEVTRKAIVVTRPEPQYTEEARKNQVSGTVVIRAVFSSSGDVTGIRAVGRLPYGLTETAIAAASRMKFIPAVKDGHYVSQYVQIEYNFNLY